ncbi:MAG: DsbA family protein [Acidobacteriota bacterium]|jgi:protein-disulfide isomerase
MKSPKRVGKVWICVLVLLLYSTSCQAKDMEESGSKELGSVDGVVITEEQVRSRNAGELESLELEFLKAKAAFNRDEHKVLREALENIIREKLASDEADRRGIPVEKLFELEVQQKIKEPTVEEIDTFYEENSERIKMSKEEAVPLVRDYLKRVQAGRTKEEFLKELENNQKVIRAMGPYRVDVKAPGRPSKGPLSAPVELVYFSDFQCTYCKDFSRTLKRVTEQYGDKVRLVYRQYPLTAIHPDAQRAAEASLCADAQDRFWEMYDLLFENSENLKDENLLKIAEQTGLDAGNFQSCLTSGRYRSVVNEDIRAGATAGVEGTPTLFVNGRYLHGNYPYQDVVAVIDEELKLNNNPQ